MYISKALDTSQYPTNIPFFLEGSNLVLFSFGIWIYIGQPNILRWLTSGFFPVNISSGVLNPRALWDILFYTYTTFLAASTHRCIGISSSYIIVFTTSMIVLFFLQHHSVEDCREWLVPSWFQLHYKKVSNTFEVYSPPLSVLSVLILLFEWFSIRTLNSLNFPNSASFAFKKYIHVFLE